MLAAGGVASIASQLRDGRPWKMREPKSTNFTMSSIKNIREVFRRPERLAGLRGVRSAHSSRNRPFDGTSCYSNFKTNLPLRIDSGCFVLDRPTDCEEDTLALGRFTIRRHMFLATSSEHLPVNSSNSRLKGFNRMRGHAMQIAHQCLG